MHVTCHVRHVQDNEQTPQIWTTCADVEVVKAVPWGLVAGATAGAVGVLGAAAVAFHKWKSHSRRAAVVAKTPAVAQIQSASVGSAGGAEPAGQLQLQVQQQQLA